MTNTDRPNVLLVVFDTARADSFSPYAKDRATPALNQLASAGVAYPKAMAPSCWTVPSHASMLMGRPPRSLGMCRIGRDVEPIAPRIRRQLERYLPAVLRRAGYTTKGLSANGWISSGNGFGFGFDEFHDVAAKRQRRMGRVGIKGKIAWYLETLKARTDDGADMIARMLDEWTTSKPHKPFFCFVNLIECHSPYLPPKPFNDFGPLKRLSVADDYRKYYTFEAFLKSIATAEVPSTRSLQRMRHLYDASVAQMDSWLARVLETLDRSGALDDTIVVVTSDHGENFGDCGLIGHGGSLDDRLLWVPLVFAGPGVAESNHADGVVALDNLPRMVADLIGIEHPWHESSNGVAVAQYDGPIDLANPAAAWFRTASIAPERLRRLTQKHTCATNGTIKIVRSESETVLYDLEADALELHPQPLTGDPRTDIAPLMRALDKAAAEELPTAAADGTEQMSEELEARMRLLGYL